MKAQRKFVAIVAAGALAMVAVAPAIAGAVPSPHAKGGKGTTICFPGPGAFTAPEGAGPGYGQYMEPPAAPQAFVNLGCPLPG